MNTYFRILIAIAIPLSLSNCKKDDMPPMQDCYEYAVTLHKEGNLNDAIFYYQLTALENQYNLEDSLAYWWKAMCGQGEVWMQKNFLSDARMDFEAVLEFAKRHKLDTAEYLACRRLAKIALRERQYENALSFHRQALMIAERRKLPPTMLQGQDAETTLSIAAYKLGKGLSLSNCIVRELERLSCDSLLEVQVMALRLLALHEAFPSNQQSHLSKYMEKQDELWDSRYQKFTNDSEREKKELIAERNETAEEQQHTLFISLALFALLLGGGIYTAAEYRRRHELDRIRTILYQKEQVIQILEREKEDSASLRHQIQEKTRQMEELAQRERKLKEMAELLHNKSQRLEDLSRQMEEMENLRKQLEQKQREWTETEADIRRSHLYDMPVGRRLPAPGNPHKPQKEDFDGFLVATDRQKAFLAEMDRCFNRFATGLMDITPGLTEEDTVYCCLFRLEIRPTDIATLMARTKSSVSKRRVRIELKLSGKDIPSPQ